MTDEAQKIIAALRTACGETCDGCPTDEWCHGNGTRSLEDDAADLIETLLLVIEQKDRELAGFDFLLTSAQSAAETYKRQLDAAAADIRAMLCEDSSVVLCEYCAHLKNEECVWMGEVCGSIVEWRGPCAENGGADNA